MTILLALIGFCVCASIGLAIWRYDVNTHAQVSALYSLSGNLTSLHQSVITLNNSACTQLAAITETLAANTALVEPVVSNLAKELSTRMDAIQAEQAVLRNRVETGPGKRTLSLRGGM